MLFLYFHKNNDVDEESQHVICIRMRDKITYVTAIFEDIEKH